MPELNGVVPYFEVFDMISSVSFYRDQLGFTLLFASPEVDTNEGRFSHFVRLGRGGAEIMLNTAYDSNERPPDRHEARWQGTRHTRLYFDCDDVRALHEEFTARGVKADPPEMTGYGMLGFSMTDPDGYGLTFHQAVRRDGASAAAV